MMNCSSCDRKISKIHHNNGFIAYLHLETTCGVQRLR